MLTPGRHVWWLGAPTSTNPLLQVKLILEFLVSKTGAVGVPPGTAGARQAITAVEEQETRTQVL